MFKKIITVLENEKFLRKKSLHFENPADLNSFERSQIQDLLDTYNIKQGYSLSAPQIGHYKRVFLLNLTAINSQDNRQTVLMINPELSPSDEKQKYLESCESIPNVQAEILRSKKCVVSFFDLDGNRKEITLDGDSSAWAQHELDHLYGVLYLDRASRLTKKILMKKVRKIDKLDKIEKEKLRKDFEEEHLEILGKKKKSHKKKSKRKK